MQSVNKEFRKPCKNPKVPHGVLNYEHKGMFQAIKSMLVRRSISDPQQHQRQGHRIIGDLAAQGLNLPCDLNNELQSETNNTINEADNEEINQIYDDIDQIYDYVRGFAPLPERLRIKCSNNKRTSIKEMKRNSPPGDENEPEAPEPPPISTIPSSQLRRMSYPTIVHEIALSSKKMEKYFTPDHIYEKIGSKNDERVHVLPHARIPMRSNSTGKIYLPSPHYNHLVSPFQSKPKLFVKSSSGQKTATKANKLMRYSKHAAHRDSINNNDNCSKLKELSNIKTCRSSRSLTTSPLFNIRYKSLTNLHFIQPPLPTHFNDTLESSNSGGQASSGSGGSKDVFKDPKAKTRKLSRPKSLTNLFWEMAGNINMDKIQNEINTHKNKMAPGLIYPPTIPIQLDVVNGQIVQQQQQQVQQQSTVNSKRIGTLYL